jgi:MscS family membrane protein
MQEPASQAANAAATPARESQIFDLSFLERWLGPASEDTFLGVDTWQWLALGLIVFVGFTLDFTVRFMARRLLARLGSKDNELLIKAARAIGLVASGATFTLGLPLVKLEGTALTVLAPAARIYLVLTATLAAFRIIDAIGSVLVERATRTASTVDDILVPLLRKTLKVLALAMGIVNLAPLMGIEIGPLLGAIGIGGLGFAFAAQNTIENIFGSITVVLDKPFAVGDWVVIEGTEGTVEQVGLRSTRIRTFYDSLVTVPNSILVKTRVDNYGERRYRRFRTMLSVRYETDPKQVEAFCEGIRQLILAHAATRKDGFHVYLNEFGGSSIDVLLYMFFEVPTWADELHARHLFMLDVMRLAKELGVDFAYPTQTVLMGRDGGQPPIPAGLAGSDAGRDIRAFGADLGRSIGARTAGGA